MDIYVPFSILASVYILCSRPVVGTETTYAETNVGTFKGYVRTVNAFGTNYRVRRFLGVPYAEPPVDNLRFQKTVRKSSFTGEYDATEMKPACLQTNVALISGGKRKKGLAVKYSEDCLYLNIYAPDGKNPRYPVMIYIHGGAYVCGSPIPYKGDILSAYGEVIVVTISYRLSVWGFLSTGDKYMPGNYGLWDQHEAIKWVYDNIDAFGGDPNTIVVFGTSAGGASAIWQSVFPGNAGIIKRAIAMSGSLTNPWGFNKHPIKATRRYAKLFGCDQDNSKELAGCIRSKSSSELHYFLNDNHGFITFPMEFIPTRDGDFIPEYPEVLLHRNSAKSKVYRETFGDVDFMTGVVAGEGIVAILPIVGVNDTEQFQVTRQKFEGELTTKIAKTYFGESSPDIVRKMIISEYTDWSETFNDTIARRAYIKASGDWLFNIQTIEAINAHAAQRRKNSYLYFNEAQVSQHVLTYPSWSDQPNHVDDLSLWFGFDPEDGFATWTSPFGENPADWEMRASKAVITIVTNFVKTGDPHTPADIGSMVGEGVRWPQYTREGGDFFCLGNDRYKKGKNLFARAFNFWTKLIPDVISAVRGTYGYCDRDGGCGD
ncbi:CEL-like protein [Mya arenaria]|uniref:Carboxylic ester hydrolase n=1 Tax=Mya arenaria TaxID=6604 RepID=A0ABY7F9J6_MYAAR|nr:cholinesterase 1-like [Mya arenaria]WAR18847.1 CEL-like protein [Mya arenaria]